MESIITSGEQNVKSEGADEKPEDVFSQKATETLGMESIITSAKRIVKFREADEKPEDGFSQKATGDLGGEYHHFGKKNCKI